MYFLRYRLLSLFIVMCVKEIFRLGKEYPFFRPERCQREGCASAKVWGHGFVLLCIDGFCEPLWFRRWRCPLCGCVHTIRPRGYWARHQTPISVIVESLSYRLTQGFWDKTLGLTRQRQGHWLRALRKNVKAWLGMDKSFDLIDGLYQLISLGRVPILRSD